jgi:hypothetical protein
MGSPWAHFMAQGWALDNHEPAGLRGIGVEDGARVGPTRDAEEWRRAEWRRGEERR